MTRQVSESIPSSFSSSHYHSSRLSSSYTFLPRLSERSQNNCIVRMRIVLVLCREGVLHYRISLYSGRDYITYFMFHVSVNDATEHVDTTEDVSIFHGSTNHTIIMIIHDTIITTYSQFYSPSLNHTPLTCYTYNKHPRELKRTTNP